MSAEQASKAPVNDETQAVRAGIDTDSAYGAITPPLYLSSNFRFKGFNQPGEYDYTRSGNPTRQLLAKALADLEQGAGAVITSSGMSAIFLVLQLLQPKDRILIPQDCYGGTYRLFKAWHDKGMVTVDFIDQTCEKSIHHGLEKKPALVWIETPSNPLLRIVDIKKLCQQAKAVGALVAVDNTFLSPALQKPLTLGADMVVHSTTKYINGHSDVVGGALIAREQALDNKLQWWANCAGLTGAPFDSFQTLRGLRTLSVRMERHTANAARVVAYLTSHKQVGKVYYPGLAGHPGHDIACEQQTGFGAMVSFELNAGADQVAKFLSELSLFSLAESLGGVESLICHPATMTHAAMSEEARHRAGIEQHLLRLSIGIEHCDDIIHDLERGFSVCNV